MNPFLKRVVWNSAWVVSLATVLGFSAIGITYTVPPILTKIALTWQPDWFATLVSISFVFGIIASMLIISYPPPRTSKMKQIA